ncbi:Protocadherin Fat 3 [Trachymyrmex septentrionalis]|uniref:Protocadherin Fat 3 n=1 Tax=Trachymyrmex septentrionalis TaxID=34720 RepID=A0A151JVH9_9HYME|nr:Protocadherin Fat 3 [Trachymyrmex septentrionalis]
MQVYVEVLDENDNTPLTELPVYYPSVPENSPASVSVLQIRAFDHDVSPQQFVFTISSGNPEGYFLINSTTGLISTSGRKLDRENQAEHVLELLCETARYIPRSSSEFIMADCRECLVEYLVASSSDLAVNAGLSPEKSPEAVDVITESRAREEQRRTTQEGKALKNCSGKA